MNFLRFGFLVTWLLSAQIALAMQMPNRHFSFKSVLLPFVPYYFCSEDLMHEDPEAIFEDRIKRRGLLPAHILASGQQVLIDLDDPDVIKFYNVDGYHLLQLMKSAIWSDIIHEQNKEPCLFLKDAAAKMKVEEQYDFIKFWILEKRTIETQYHVFSKGSRYANVSPCGIPYVGFPHLLKLTSFLPYQNNSNGVNLNAQIPLLIDENNLHLALAKQCLYEKEIYINFRDAIDDLNIYVAKQLFENTAQLYLPFIGCSFKRAEEATKPAERVKMLRKKSSFFYRLK